MVTPTRGSRVSRLLQWQRRDAIIVEREAVARLDAERRSSWESCSTRGDRSSRTIIELSKVRRQDTPVLRDGHTWSSSTYEAEEEEEEQAGARRRVGGRAEHRARCFLREAKRKDGSVRSL